MSLCEFFGREFEINDWISCRNLNWEGIPQEKMYSQIRDIGKRSLYVSYTEEHGFCFLTISSQKRKLPWQLLDHSSLKCMATEIQTWKAHAPRDASHLSTRHCPRDIRGLDSHSTDLGLPATFHRCDKHLSYLVDCCKGLSPCPADCTAVRSVLRKNRHRRTWQKKAIALMAISGQGRGGQVRPFQDSSISSVLVRVTIAIIKTKHH